MPLVIDLPGTYLCSWIKLFKRLAASSVGLTHLHKCSSRPRARSLSPFSRASRTSRRRSATSQQTVELCLEVRDRCLPCRLQDLWIGKDQGLSYRHLPEAERAAESFPLFDHLRGDLRFPAAIRADQTYPSPWVKR